MADVPVLVGTTGSLRGKKIVVPEGGLKLGRAPDNDVVVETDGTSRYHATLLYDNGTLWLRDTGSRNGVFVNDIRVVGHKALKVGDAVSILGNRLEVRWDAPDQPAPPTLQTADASKPSDRLAEDDETSEVERPASKRSWFWPFS
jgi:pSer/pThr/pTyr-binding forkhead associated (FHA) protein